MRDIIKKYVERLKLSKVLVTNTVLVAIVAIWQLLGTFGIVPDYDEVAWSEASQFITVIIGLLWVLFVGGNDATNPRGY